MLFAFLFVSVVSVSAHAQQRVTLQDAVAMAQRQSYQSRVAEATRDAARSRYRAYGASLLPQISLAGDVPIYNRSIIPVLQPDGSTLFRAQEQNQAALTMNVSQRLPYAGGELFMTSALSRVDVVGAQTTRNWSSTPFSVGIRQNLMRPNTASWDAREQDLRIDAADRAFLEAREDIAVTTVTIFFDHYAAKVALGNALANTAVNDTLYTLNKGRFEVGKIGENDLLQSELALLRAQTTLDGARLEFDRTLAALRLQLNLPAGTPLDVVAPDVIPDIRADTLVAVSEALRNRAQIVDLSLQEVQADRRLNEARLNTGIGATVQASMGFNQSGSQMDAVYRDLREAQRFSVGLQVPLVQWGSRSAQIQAARSDQIRVDNASRQTREQLIQEAHFAALQLGQSARQFVLSAKGDTIGAKQFEVAKNRYIIGTIALDNLYQTQTSKDQALLQYGQSMRNYWLAYYRLRRATLYDFERNAVIR